MKQIEKKILKETKDLPPSLLKEILDFIQFIKAKKIEENQNSLPQDNINADLSLLDEKELLHLEEEFLDYKVLYPREK